MQRNLIADRDLQLTVLTSTPEILWGIVVDVNGVMRTISFTDSQMQKIVQAVDKWNRRVE